MNNCVFLGAERIAGTSRKTKKDYDFWSLNFLTEYQRNAESVGNDVSNVIVGSDDLKDFCNNIAIESYVGKSVELNYSLVGKYPKCVGMKMVK